MSKTLNLLSIPYFVLAFRYKKMYDRLGSPPYINIKANKFSKN